MSFRGGGDAAEELAQRFHEAYERLAPDFGYRTREASAKPWARVPEDNRQLMIAVAGEILDGLGAAAGPCGHRSPMLAIPGCSDLTAPSCDLMAGHAGWHVDSVTGAKWGKPWTDAAIRADERAAVRAELLAIAAQEGRVIRERVIIHNLADRIAPEPPGGQQ